MDDQDPEWQGKGATLTHGTAQKEFGLTYDEIVGAIRAGKLQYRQASIHGNPALRLLRREIEALARELRGDRGAQVQKLELELAQIEREQKRLKKQLADLDRQRARLVAELAELARPGESGEDSGR